MNTFRAAITVQPASDPEEEPHPRYEDFPDHTAYVQAFHTWRARRRENRLNPEEMAAQWAVVEHAILNRPGR